MKLAVACLLSLGLVACQRADATHGTPSATQTEVVAAAPAVPAGMCGEAGGQCGGQCGGGCMADMAAPEAPAAPVPNDALWTSMPVTGMHCGGCARRIQRALAKVDGILGVEVDLGTHTVKVAVAQGTDARALAVPAITSLGYGVPAS